MPRGLSVTLWLIIICTGIFMIDAVCYSRGVLFAVHFGDRVLTTVDPAKEKLIYPPVPKRPPSGALGADYPIVRASNGEQVGARSYRWMPPFQAMGHFSTAKGFLALEVWRLVTFQFLHADLTHLLMNMIGLWFFGPMVEHHLVRRRRMLAYYLACGVFGAVAYLSLNLLGNVIHTRVPGLLFIDMYTPLIGASAGVFGILMAAAKIAGDAGMLLFFIPMKVRTGAYLLTAAAAVKLIFGMQNAGGEAAHLGGAISGYFLIRNAHLLNDFLDIFGSRSPRSATTPKRTRAPRPSSQNEVDRILDKASREGMHSLTKREQKVLKDATEKLRREG